MSSLSTVSSGEASPFQPRTSCGSCGLEYLGAAAMAAMATVLPGDQPPSQFFHHSVRGVHFLPTTGASAVTAKPLSWRSQLRKWAANRKTRIWHVCKVESIFSKNLSRYSDSVLSLHHLFSLACKEQTNWGEREVVASGSFHFDAVAATLPSVMSSATQNSEHLRTRKDPPEAPEVQVKWDTKHLHCMQHLHSFQQMAKFHLLPLNPISKLDY